ncbi:cysteine proteinase RD21a-like protein [Cinnamomum micranthum f. kanehirae]|uniref:Cysteine proteinase RD21a-like protein n=1 Tax=Cinnamomum micranthum f. kanehirae TaxID=337451 RepID=A0A443NHW3_9MAGN|nr:cysteine proteinase RD21a-like protein [Cinnamomum micranthum f. kanehirae]
MAMQTGSLWASHVKKILLSAGIVGYTGWSFVRNGGFSDAASRQISAIKKCLTQKTENMDAKPDGEENMSKLSEEKTSKSVYNEPILPYLGSGYKDVEKARMSAMFEEWVIKHNRMYRSMAEKEKRFLIFYSKVLKIEAHNNSGCYSYTLGLNEFSDLTEAEYRRKHVGVIIRRD